MKAIVYSHYGPPDVLELCEVDKPTPNDEEVLIQVHAASLNFGDVSLVRGEPFLVRLMGAGLFRPKNRILGSDLAGTIVAVGRNVRRFRPGDEVFGDVSRYGWGGWAEYVTVPEKAVALKPTKTTFEEAAAVPQAAVVALQGLRQAGVQPGKTVLVNGASGGIGTFAVQIARTLGAEVTGVCSTRNVGMVRSIGADWVIDYTQEDFANNGRRYDVILATAGYRPILDYRRALCPGGTYVMVGGASPQVFQAILLGPWLSMNGSRKLSNLSSRPSQEDLALIIELIEAGEIQPVIDRRYPLSEVAEAVRYYGAGHAQGKVVITVTPQ